MNTHFFVFDGECYVAHYKYFKSSAAIPRLITITNLLDQQIIPTTKMIRLAQNEIIAERYI